jgi:hypothetical protein
MCAPAIWAKMTSNGLHLTGKVSVWPVGSVMQTKQNDSGLYPKIVVHNMSCIYQTQCLESTVVISTVRVSTWFNFISLFLLFFCEDDWVTRKVTLYGSSLTRAHRSLLRVSRRVSAWPKTSRETGLLGAQTLTNHLVSLGCPTSWRAQEGWEGEHTTGRQHITKDSPMTRLYTANWLIIVDNRFGSNQRVVLYRSVSWGALTHEADTQIKTATVRWYTVFF